jgi:sterol desaturase/sphingolipid hydroxylase (fatty acid hydroxylase superfamily)
LLVKNNNGLKLVTLLDLIKYIDIFIRSFTEYAEYLYNEMLPYNKDSQWYENYFYWLILISLIFWVWEIIWPWRKEQKVFRKDFWLDAFYMFFNFFLFSLIIYNSVSNVFVSMFKDLCSALGFENGIALRVETLPLWAKLCFAFVLKDFIHWNIHRLLHRVPFLWQFHKLHHSAVQMGFAAHLRFHWMETMVYNTLQYIPLAILGFGLQEYFFVHIISLSIGHFNHSNIRLKLGLVKYIINNPQMHLWHHAKDIPEKHGVNFGLSLSVWDYIFKTAYIPNNNANVELGFKNIESYPTTFFKQMLYPFGKRISGYKI